MQRRCGHAMRGRQPGRPTISPSHQQFKSIYAQLQASRRLDSGCGTPWCQLAAYRTTNGGASWTEIPGSTGAALRNCGNAAGDYPQNWYDQGVAVDPNNPDRAFFDTFEVWFWANGNASWNDTTCGYSGSTQVVHVDQHALAFVPGSSSILLAGNDGGVHGTTNANAASATVDPTWFNMDTGFNTIEFYSGDISGDFATSPTPQAKEVADKVVSVSFSGSPTGPWLGTGQSGDGFYGVRPVWPFLFGQQRGLHTAHTAPFGATCADTVPMDNPLPLYPHSFSTKS